MKNIVTLLICAISYLSFSQTNAEAYVFNRLTGEFNLVIYSPSMDPDSQWIESGTGIANFETFFDGTYIRERVQTTINGNTYNMDNTIGIDSRNSGFRLIAVDKEFSTMDVFNGKFENEKLVFDNLRSDIKMFNPKGDEINFKLTYTFLDGGKNELLVEYSKDSGKSWMPFSKQLQVPKTK